MTRLTPPMPDRLNDLRRRATARLALIASADSPMPVKAAPPPVEPAG